MHAEPITITVRYAQGTYVARAKGSRHTASCTHDLVLAARNLARKLDLDVLGMKRGPDRDGVATFEAWPLTSGPIAEIYGELWRKASSMGYESVTEALADLERRKAAEQPNGTTSDKYRAELYDEVWEKARGMGYGNVTNALVELGRMKAAEQPDSVKLAEALKPFADAFEATGLPQYKGADDEHMEFLDENQITPVRGITMRQFRQAWEVLNGKSALLAGGEA